MGILGWLLGSKRARGSDWLPAPGIRQGRGPSRRREAAAPEKRVFGSVVPPGWRSVTDLVVNVVGEQHYRADVLAFHAGTDCACEAVREPDNPYDANAIAIIGVFVGAGGPRRTKLGFVPRGLARRIALDRPADMPLMAMPYSTYVRGDFVDLKVRLLEPSARSEWWKSHGLEPPKGKLVDES